MQNSYRSALVLKKKTAKVNEVLITIDLDLPVLLRSSRSTIRVCPRRAAVNHMALRAAARVGAGYKQR